MKLGDVVIVGALPVATESYVVPFVVSETMIALGGAICLPARRIARWEASPHPRQQQQQQQADRPPTTGAD